MALWRTFGWRGVAQRARFEARRGMNALRERPQPTARAVATAPMPDEWPFVPDARRVRGAAERDVALERARRVSAGQHHAYRWTWAPRPGTPAEWLTHPESGYRYGEDITWWRVAHFDSQAGDIKDVWEPARFAWVYDLARGWMLTGDETFVRAFATGLSTFLEAAPPFRGPHWACGQETSIRAIAWLWAEGAFREAPTFAGAIRGTLLEALAWSGERVDDAFEYAQSQRNNHGLSEAAGLVSIGARLRGADARAERWIDRGHRALEHMILDQIASDGWYIQHSFTYARLALDQLTTARRALRSVGRDLSSRAQDRVRSLIDLIAACIDPTTGDLPNHGPNDGAHVLPLSTRPYRDFRPSLTAAAATFGAPLPEHAEPNVETLAWLSAEAPVRHRPPDLPWVRTGESGWLVGATVGARVFARAGRYRSRPGHIDPAHVDVWLGGKATAIDAGTFRYAARPPWNNGLAGIEVHNTVSITGIEAAIRGPRFLWLTWPSARIESAVIVGDEITLDIVNDSWRAHGVSHRRTCTLRVDAVMIVDEIRGGPAFTAPVHVHWLVEDWAALTFECSVASTVTEVCGDAQSTRGWVAPSYGVKRPARSVRLTAVPRAGTLRIVSTFEMMPRSTGTQDTAVDARVQCST